MTRRSSPSRRSSAGFSLMEVLIAMGIFLIGIVAVAAVFPTGVAVQRRTVEDLTSQAVARNAKQIMTMIAISPDTHANGPLTYHHDATIASRSGTLAGFTEDGGRPTPEDAQRVAPMFDFDLPVAAGVNQAVVPSSVSGSPKTRIAEALSPLSLRGYPSFYQPTTKDAGLRDYYWFPLIQITDDPTTATTLEWLCHIMIVRREGSNPVPRIGYVEVEEDFSSTSRIQFTDSMFSNDANNDGLPDLIGPGDWVLADNGQVHRVILADADGITVDSAVVSAGFVPKRLYFAANVDSAGNARRNGSSPIVRIETFGLPVLDLLP